MPALYQLDGSDVVRVHELTEPISMIGRDLKNQIVLYDSSVSRFHSRLTVTESGAFVEDLETTNGTWLSGRRIFELTEVLPGMRLQLGSQVLVFWAHPSADETIAGTRFQRRSQVVSTTVSKSQLNVPSDTSYNWQFRWKFFGNGFAFKWRIRRT